MKTLIDAILYFISGQYIDDQLEALMKHRNAVTEEEKEKVRKEFFRKRLHGYY